MSNERNEQILTVIDQLGVASIKQLHQILKLGSYRNTCKVIERLEPFLHVSRGQQKIVYLNKEGRELIGSEKEMKKSVMFDHMLLTNDAFIYYDCPGDWKREYHIETKQQPDLDFAIQVIGLKVATKKIVPDAVFMLNRRAHLVEIDNTRSMLDNRRKIKRYKEMWSDITNHFGSQPKICIFTKSEKRKKEFKQLCEKLPCEVMTFAEI